MSLQIKLSGNILRVMEKSEECGFSKVYFWYYDINAWRVSSHGKENDTPDRDMTADSILWVRKHYLPRVGIPFKE